MSLAHIRDELISFFELEEGDAQLVDAVITSGNDLTNNNVVTSGEGKVGADAVFVAADSQSLSHADNPSLSTGDINFSLNFWAKLTDKDSDYAFVSRDDEVNREYLCRYDNGTDRFRWIVFDSGGSIIGDVSSEELGSPVIDTWYNIYVEHNAVDNTVSIIVNAGDPDTAATTGTPADKTVVFMLGARASNNNFLNGELDQVAFAKRLWETDEIASVYNHGNGVSFSDMVLEGMMLSTVNLGLPILPIFNRATVGSSDPFALPQKAKRLTLIPAHDGTVSALTVDLEVTIDEGVTWRKAITGKVLTTAVQVLDVQGLGSLTCRLTTTAFTLGTAEHAIIVAIAST